MYTASTPYYSMRSLHHTLMCGDFCVAVLEVENGICAHTMIVNDSQYSML